MSLLGSYAVINWFSFFALVAKGIKFCCGVKFLG